MKKSSLAFLILICLLASGCFQRPQLARTFGPTASCDLETYVALSQNDAVPVRYANPGDDLNVILSEMLQTGSLTLYLHGGTYYLSEPLRLTADHSGITIRNVPNETPVLSGGRVVTGWQAYNQDIYRASVGEARFRQLYVNGTRAVRAREPNDGYYRLVSWDMNGRRIQVHASQAAGLEAADYLELHAQKQWNVDILRVASISGEYVTPREPERRLSFNGNPPERDGQPFHFENALELLNEPGEWFLDERWGHLYYYPREGEYLQEASVVVPTLETLVSIVGSPETLVADVTLHSITFEYANWLRPSEYGFVGRQAGWFRWATIPGAVQVEFAANLTFERNVLQHLGGSGLVLFQGTRETLAIGNVVRDVSGNGISIEMRSERDATEAEQCKRDVVNSNYITEVGQDYPGSVAIFGGYPDSATIRNNEIHSAPYTGISVGWGWTLDETPLRNNVIAYNDVHNVMQLLSDGGGIYTLSSQPGTVITENYVHDIQRSPWAPQATNASPIAGIYLDNGSDYMTVEDNVMVDVPKTVHVNAHLAGQHNVIRNNDGYSQTVVDAAGLLPEYQDIKPTPVPTATPTNTPTSTPVPTATPTVTPGAEVPVNVFCDCTCVTTTPTPE